MPKIQPFGDDLDAMRSVRFQWALHLFRQADACRHREDAQREAICSPADLEAFSVHVRQHVDEAIGGVPDLPEQIPYKVVREFVFDDVRTQLITFESFPGFAIIDCQLILWELGVVVPGTPILDCMPDVASIIGYCCPNSL